MCVCFFSFLFSVKLFVFFFSFFYEKFDGKFKWSESNLTGFWRPIETVQVSIFSLDKTTIYAHILMYDKPNSLCLFWIIEFPSLFCFFFFVFVFYFVVGWLILFLFLFLFSKQCLLIGHLLKFICQIISIGKQYSIFAYEHKIFIQDTHLCFIRKEQSFSQSNITNGESLFQY